MTGGEEKIHTFGWRRYTECNDIFHGKHVTFKRGLLMKAAHLVCLLVCLLFAAFVHAQEKDDPAKEAQIKQQVLKDIKKTCTPQKKQSDKAWQEMILSSEANQLLIKMPSPPLSATTWMPTGGRLVKWIVWKIIEFPPGGAALTRPGKHF